METTQFLNSDLISTTLSILLFVVLPFYVMIKYPPYKRIKKISLTISIIMAVFSAGIFIISLILNSFIIFISAPIFILFVYYLMLYLIATFLNKQKIQSLLVVYLLHGLFFIPVLWLCLDLYGFGNFWAHIFFSPIDMK